MLSHEELEGLAEGYVLLALEPKEQQAFEAHLAACDRCFRRVAELRPVAGALGLLAQEAEPPAGLKERIVAAAAASGPAQPATATTPARLRKPLKALWRVLTRPATVGVAAALLLLAVAGLAYWVFQLEGELDSRERRLEAMEVRVTRGYRAINIMAQADRRWSFEGTEMARGAKGVLAYSSQQSAACLVAWDLPPAQDKKYQAWAVKEGAYSRVGALWKMDDGLWIIVPGKVDQLDMVTITLEEPGNSKKPTGPVVARIPVGSQ